jgi:branched-subunit amino acid aminotransferase/4-amino-4-deoxychorismate lyase
VTLRAADSWLVDDGRVRGWDLHWARFGAAADVDARALEAELRRELPREGRWFPRVECDDRGELSWRLRPAPPRAPFVDCRSEPVADPRSSPRVKGPDLDALIALRPDPGELLLTGADGTVLEGCLTSLLWWDGETLCVVDDDAPILDGVTRRLLIGVARDAGVEVVRRRPRIGELFGCEVWLTSALHGIRVVNDWIGGPAAVDLGLAARWQASLEDLALPI